MKKICKHKYETVKENDHVCKLCGHRLIGVLEKPKKAPKKKKEEK